MEFSILLTLNSYIQSTRYTPVHRSLYRVLSILMYTEHSIEYSLYSCTQSTPFLEFFTDGRLGSSGVLFRKTSNPSPTVILHGNKANVINGA